MSSGYISDQVRARIRAQAKNRCGYCSSHQDYILRTLKIDHFIPLSKGIPNGALRLEYCFCPSSVKVYGLQWL
jgi:5-methylcytosine-specific restriction endonuclease McrA